MKSRTLAVVFAAASSLVAVTLSAAPASATSYGTVHVQLVSPAGKPLALAGGLVRLRDKSGDFDSLEETGADGSYTFAAVPRGSDFTVALPAQGAYLAHTTSRFTVSSTKTTSIKLTSAVGAVVEGGVENNRAAGLGFADVALLTSSGNVAASGKTDSLGNYLIAGVKSGTYRVQFNSRKVESNNLDPRTMAWSYWAGSGKPSTQDWTKAKVLTVKQQSAHSSGTVAQGVSGEVGSVSQIDGPVTYWSPASSHAYQPVTFIAQHNADSFSTEFNSLGVLSVLVNPGKYRIAIRGDYDPILEVYPLYWYVSDSRGPTSDESKATWVNVTGIGTTLHFIPFQPN